MGRAPCCDKANVKRGPWSPEEDVKLKSYIEQNGTGGNWIALPQKIGLKRCGKSCRLRWLNYLRPNLKHGGFSEEEDNIICSLYISIGSRWSIIAAQLPGRTDNDIKNYWNTRLKKKLLGKQRKDHQQVRRVKTEPKANMENGVCEDGSRSMYWPGPSAPTYQISQDVDGQASIKKLLIKLGGWFSDEHGVGGHRSPFPIDPPMLPPQPLYRDPANLMSIQASTTNGSFMDCLQGSTEFPMEFEEIFPCSSMKLDGLDCLYGDGSRPSTSESANWNEVGPLIYPPLVAGYHGMQQCLFEDPVNLGMQ